MWAKMDRPKGVYSDLTRVGFVGDSVPEKFEKIFRIVAAARDASIACVKEAFAAGRPIAGGTVDDASRKSSSTPVMANILSIAPATTSVKKLTATEPISTIWKPVKTACCSLPPASPSNREFICPSLACAARLMSLSIPTEPYTSQADYNKL